MAESPPSVSTPEHPNWMPWWVRYAEYGGRCAVLADASLLDDSHRDRITSRYILAIREDLPLDCPEHDHCVGWPSWVSRKEFYKGDSLDEALAAFAEAERVLLGREA